MPKATKTVAPKVSKSTSDDNVTKENAIPNRPAAESAYKLEISTLKKAKNELDDENTSLRTEMEGMEKERDFYFEKLRDIEITLQVCSTVCVQYVVRSYTMYYLVCTIHTILTIHTIHTKHTIHTIHTTQEMEDKGEGTKLSADLFKILYATVDGFEVVDEGIIPLQPGEAEAEIVPAIATEEAF